MNGCIAVSAHYISYIVSLNVVQWEVVCIVFSAIFHWTFLSSAAAMTIMVLHIWKPKKTWQAGSILISWG